MDRRAARISESNSLEREEQEEEEEDNSRILTRDDHLIVMGVVQGKVVDGLVLLLGSNHRRL